MCAISKRSFLITYKYPIRIPISICFPPCFPVNFIACEKRKIHSGSAGSLHIIPLFFGPIFIVAGGYKKFMVQQQATIADGVYISSISYIVSITFKPAYHRVAVV